MASGVGSRYGFNFHSYYTNRGTHGNSESSDEEAGQVSTSETDSDPETAIDQTTLEKSESSDEAEQAFTSETDSDPETANSSLRVTSASRKVSIMYADDTDYDPNDEATSKLPPVRMPAEKVADDAVTGFESDNQVTNVFSRSAPQPVANETDSNDKPVYPNISPHKAPLKIPFSQKIIKQNLRRLVPVRLFAEKATNTYEELIGEDNEKKTRAKEKAKQTEYSSRAADYRLQKDSAKSLLINTTLDIRIFTN